MSRSEHNSVLWYGVQRSSIYDSCEDSPLKKRKTAANGAVLDAGNAESICVIRNSLYNVYIWRENNIVDAWKLPSPVFCVCEGPIDYCDVHKHQCFLAGCSNGNVYALEASERYDGDVIDATDSQIIWNQRGLTHLFTISTSAVLAVYRTEALQLRCAILTLDEDNGHKFVVNGDFDLYEDGVSTDKDDIATSELDIRSNVSTMCLVVPNTSMAKFGSQTNTSMNNGNTIMLDSQFFSALYGQNTALLRLPALMWADASGGVWTSVIPYLCEEPTQHSPSHGLTTRKLTSTSSTVSICGYYIHEPTTAHTQFKGYNRMIFVGKNGEITSIFVNKENTLSYQPTHIEGKHIGKGSASEVLSGCIVKDDLVITLRTEKLTEIFVIAAGLKSYNPEQADELVPFLTSDSAIEFEKKETDPLYSLTQHSNAPSYDWGENTHWDYLTSRVINMEFLCSGLVEEERGRVRVVGSIVYGNNIRLLTCLTNGTVEWIDEPQHKLNSVDSGLESADQSDARIRRVLALISSQSQLEDSMNQSVDTVSTQLHVCNVALHIVQQIRISKIYPLALSLTKITRTTPTHYTLSFTLQNNTSFFFDSNYWPFDVLVTFSDFDCLEVHVDLVFSMIGFQSVQIPLTTRCIDIFDTSSQGNTTVNTYPSNSKNTITKILNIRAQKQTSPPKEQKTEQYHANIVLNIHWKYTCKHTLTASSILTLILKSEPIVCQFPQNDGTISVSVDPTSIQTLLQKYTDDTTNDSVTINTQTGLPVHIRVSVKKERQGYRCAFAIRSSSVRGVSLVRASLVHRLWCVLRKVGCEEKEDDVSDCIDKVILRNIQQNLYSALESDMAVESVEKLITTSYSVLRK